MEWFDFLVSHANINSGMKKLFREKLRGLGVFIVYLFGSRSRGKGFPMSDVDIGVVLKASIPAGDARSIYQSLYEIFTELYPSSKVDIVLLQCAPLTLQYSAIREGKILFEEDPIHTADYENGVINRYLDFIPILDYFDSMVARRYAQS
jgi:hypothetical protein